MHTVRTDRAGRRRDNRSLTLALVLLPLAVGGFAACSTGDDPEVGSVSQMLAPSTTICPATGRLGPGRAR